MDNFLRLKRKKNEILKSKELGLRRRLVSEWYLLNEEQKLITRSIRAKKGIKCSKCGSVGYFIEICPNNCYEPPKKEEVIHHGLERFGSDDNDSVGTKEPDGEGYFWTFNNNDNQELEKPKKSYYNTKADLSNLRKQVNVEKERLRLSDEKLTEYEFYRNSQEGYYQNLSELSLHQALRYFMRILEKEIENNIHGLEAKDDLTLFHPPSERITSHFYPKEVGKIKEYREYFHNQEMKKDRQIHAHQHYGSIRPEDQMSVYYRSKNLNEMMSVYEPNPIAGQSMHGKIGWKSILSTGDDLAISDPRMMEKLNELKELETKQSKWVQQQQIYFQHQNERYQHMWNIIKTEITLEHDREKRLLLVDKDANQRETEIQIWKERFDAADRIMKTLVGYELLTGTNEADYIIQNLKKWKEEIIKNQKQILNSSSTESNNSLQRNNNKINTNKNLKKGKKKGKKKELKKQDSSLIMSSLVRIKAKNKDKKDKTSDNEDGTDEGTDTDQEDDLLENNNNNNNNNNNSSNNNNNNNQNTNAKLKGEGGYYGLGLLSTMGAKEISHSFESSTSVTGRLLMNGSMGLIPLNSIGNESDLQSLQSFSSKSKNLKSLKTETKKSIKSIKLQHATTIMERRKLEEKQMRELATRYSDVGLKRNIREGTSNDTTSRAPVLIPFHEVVSNHIPPEEQIQSYVGNQAMIEARKRDANPTTGMLSPKYVPLYVRSTLFEVNGTTPGGDQTYAKMSHDRRYSHQLGRTMASLEPIPLTKKKIQEIIEDSKGETAVKNKLKIRLV